MEKGEPTMGWIEPTPDAFLKRFIAQRVYTVCIRINYNIVPVTNFNKYLHNGTSGTE
jgi:hypothetical protein